MGINHIPLPPARQTVSAAELRRNFGVWQERAFSAPVIVIRHGKPRLVLSSAEQFFDRDEAAAASTDRDEVLASAYAAIPAHSSEGLLVLDRSLRILAVNGVFEDQTGRSASRMIGRAWLEIFPEAAESVAVSHFNHVLRTGASTQFDTPSVLVEGRHYRFTVFPHAGGIAALIVNRTHEALMASEIDEYRSLANTFAMVPTAGYLKINLRALIYGASKQVPDILGYDFPAHPLPLPDITTPDQRPGLLAAIDSVLSGGASRRLTIALLTRSGELLPTQMSIATIWRGGKPDGAMAFFYLQA